MFGINTNAIKTAFSQFESNTSNLQTSTDPWVAALVTFIKALATAFGVKN